MSSGTDPIPSPNPPPPPNGTEKPDFQILNNGVKLLGEAVVPGASLLLEKHVGAGLLLGGLGVLGSAAIGRTFGPLGYLLTRYGTSAVSFSQSLKEPPPPNGSSKQALQTATTILADTNRAIREQTAVVQQVMGVQPAMGVRTSERVPAFSPERAAATTDLTGELRGLNERLDRLFGLVQSGMTVQPAPERTAATADLTGELRGLNERLDRLSGLVQSGMNVQPAPERTAATADLTGELRGLNERLDRLSGLVQSGMNVQPAATKTSAAAKTRRGRA